LGTPARLRHCKAAGGIEIRALNLSLRPLTEKKERWREANLGWLRDAPGLTKGGRIRKRGQV